MLGCFKLGKLDFFDSDSDSRKIILHKDFDIGTLIFTKFIHGRGYKNESFIYFHLFLESKTYKK